jgi:hypothetical protein
MHDDIVNTRSIPALLIAVALATAATAVRAQLVAGCPQMGIPR